MLDVPLIGGAPPRGTSRRLSRTLHELWVVLPETGTERQLTSVLAVIWNTRRLGHASSGDYLLSLQMWAPHLQAETRLDDDAMGLELASALDAACAADT